MGFGAWAVRQTGLVGICGSSSPGRRRDQEGERDFCPELLSDSDVAPNYAESELAMMPRLLSGSSSHV